MAVQFSYTAQLNYIMFYIRYGIIYILITTNYTRSDIIQHGVSRVVADPARLWLWLQKCTHAFESHLIPKLE